MFFLSAAAILHVFRQKPERLCELATEKEVPQGGNYSPFISVFPATNFLPLHKQAADFRLFSFSPDFFKLTVSTTTAVVAAAAAAAATSLPVS